MQELLENNLKAGQKRQIVAKEQFGSKIIVDNTEYVNLSSNDYIGLGSNLEVSQDFLSNLPKDALRQSSSGSPLLTGAHPSYQRATDAMEKLFHKSALFFDSGFAANSGTIEALATPNNLIIADKLSHASIIEGMMTAKGKTMRFAHNNITHLKTLLDKFSKDFDSVIIATEAIFSMDGDGAPLKELVEIKHQYDNVYLYVDEAHSFCLYNDNGAGLCAKYGITEDVDFILTTFGKGLGSQGACMLCNEIAKNYLINTARSLIFSTALSPYAFAHIAYMVEYMQKRNDLRQRLHTITHAIHETLNEVNLENVSVSQIIPILTYENEKALEACQFFKENGFYAMPIRHPTVPKGQARLRLSLSANLTDSEVNKLQETIKAFAKTSAPTKG